MFVFGENVIRCGGGEKRSAEKIAPEFGAAD
jgi:hypothetical protein